MARIALLLVTTFALGADALATVGLPLDGGAIPATGGGGGEGGANGAPPQGVFPPAMLLMIGGFFLLMIIMTSMTTRKEKKQLTQMLGSLARHDKVMTNGGIIGVITEVRDDEIVLKVDESTNTRIRFSKAAVKTVLKKSGEPEVISEEARADSIEEVKPVETASV